MKYRLLALFVFVVGICFGQDPADGLIAHYAFDNNGLDTSGNERHGTVFGASFTEDRNGNPNSAMLFDGIDDFFELPNLPELKPDFPVSFSFWIRYDSDSVSDRDVFNTSFKEDESSGIFFNSSASSGQYSVSFGDGSPAYTPATRRTYTTTEKVDTEVWHHIVLVINGELDMLIYVDCNFYNGVYSGGGGTLFYSNTAGNIGRHDRDLGVPANYFKGAIDDFRYYNRELTDTDVARLCYTLDVQDNVLENGFKVDLSIYPNPVKDFVNLQPQGDIQEKLMVYNSAGQLVYSGPFTHKLYVGMLPAGMYIIKSQGVLNSKTIRFVKE